MNIVTFAPPVSVKPRLYMVSLYYGTMTKDAFLSNGVGILQVLSRNHKDLVPVLGKRTGYDPHYDKGLECEKLGFPWMALEMVGNGNVNENVSDGGSTKSNTHRRLFGIGLYNDDGEKQKETNKALERIQVLPHCESYIMLKVINTMEGGDHELALCEVLAVGKWDEERGCVVDVNTDSDDEARATVAKAMDEKSVLYTGYLREEGII